MRAVPPEVAAYAAALHHQGAGTWSRVAELVAFVGLGDFSFRELARAATAWSRRRCSSAVLAQLRKLQARQAKEGAVPS
ncbi:MAG TPA: hypothetical protein VJ140_10190 [Actinomycetota bacterium]|nr:hypothetical protein [Actinomycetota bacterium]